MKNIEIKKKIINHLMRKGKKKTSEKILLQSLKELQKESFKQTKNLIKLALTFSMPIFKLTIIEYKKKKKKKKKKSKVKEIPVFITNNQSRISFTIKFILKIFKKNPPKSFHNQFCKEILLHSQYKGETILIKDEIQKKVLLLQKKKRYFRSYKWRR